MSTLASQPGLPSAAADAESTQPYIAGCFVSNVPSVRWPKRWAEAIRLCSERHQSLRAIAEQLGMGHGQLVKWTKRPDWAVAMAAYQRDVYREVRNAGIGKRAQRIIRLDKDWQRLQRIAEKRAREPEMATIPGGETGLLVKTVKGIGSKDTFERVEEFKVDTALLAELRAHEEQAARELGQWREQVSIQATNKTYVNLPGPMHDIICRSKDDGPAEQPALEAPSPEP